MRRANLRRLSFGLFSLSLLAVYFAIVDQCLSENLEPETVVGIAEHMLDSHLSDARDSRAVRLCESAPAWVEALSERTREAIATMRRHFEQYALDRTEQIAAEVVEVSDEHLCNSLSRNRRLLADTLNDLAASGSDNPMKDHRGESADVLP